MPRVSVLMPIYNAAEFLEETLATIKAQTYDDFELVVVNDGSTDHWAEILEATGLARVRVIEQENQGLVAALNNGLSAIDAEYIARADGDDLYFPNRLADQVELMDFARLDATAPRVLNIDERGRPIWLSNDASDFYLQDPTAVPPKEPYLQHPFMMVRGDVLRKLGFRNAHLSEDADLCWRLFDGYRVHMSSDVLGKYRIHTSSVSSGSVGKARVQAFYAALAALNAQRCRSGREEIVYQGTLAEAIGRARSLDELIYPYVGVLEARERAWLGAAASAKLLDLATWRNFRIVQRDFDEAKAHFKAYPIKDVATREKLRSMIKVVHQKMLGETWDKVEKPSFIKRLWEKRSLF